MKVRKGKILGFAGSWMSGLGSLIVEEDGMILNIPCENAQTVRCLEGAFGNVIGAGHTVNPKGGHVGREIYFSMDDMGLILEAFTPVEDAPPELVRIYEEAIP